MNDTFPDWNWKPLSGYIKTSTAVLGPCEKDSPYNHWQPNLQSLSTTDKPVYNHFKLLKSQLTTTFNHWQASLQPLSTTDKSAYNHWQASLKPLTTTDKPAYIHFQPLTSQHTSTFNHWQANLQPLPTMVKSWLNLHNTTMVKSWLYLHNHGEIPVNQSEASIDKQALLLADMQASQPIRSLYCHTSTAIGWQALS